MGVPKRSNRISRRGAAVMCSPIRAGFMALRSGYVDTIDGKPSFTDWTGEQSPIAGSLLGWVDCWQRFNTGLDFTAHLILHKKLTDGALLTIAEIDAAIALLRQQEALLPRLPHDFIKNQTNTELIAISMDELGISREAA